MKVLHVIPSISLGEGGPSAAVRLMAAGLQQAGVEVHVAATDDNGRGSRLPFECGVPVGVDGMTAFLFPKQLHFYKVSLPFTSWLQKHVEDYDLIHIHALFSFTSVMAARIASSRKVPYIIRPLGLLNNYGMTQRRPWLKQLSMRWIEGPALAHAACVHYTSKEELNEAENAGVRSPSAVIPLGIDLTPFELPGDPDLFLASFEECREREVILFMSRVDPKKGLELLLRVFSEVYLKHPNARLVIAGSGEPAYEKQLKDEARQLGISNAIIWTGFIEGSLKQAALSAATLFVLPSYSENFGIAAVEALAAGKACVLSDRVAIAAEQVRDRDAGLVVPCEQAALVGAINRLLDDGPLRETLGRRARQMSRDLFSVYAMATEIKRLYESITETVAQRQ